MRTTTVILISFFVMSSHIQGQVVSEQLFGSWVKTSIQYKTGDPVSEEIMKNFEYFRLIFEDDAKVFRSIDPLNKGFQQEYELYQNKLSVGFINYFIEHLSQDSLVIVEEGANGFIGKVLSITLVPEDIYRDNLPLNPLNVLELNGEVVYNEDEKVYAGFLLDIPLGVFLMDNNSGSKMYEGTGEIFFASCIIDKSGKINDVIIHKGLDKKFNKKFLDAIQMSNEYITPASLGDTNVSVLRFIELPFSASGRILSEGKYITAGYYSYFTEDVKKGIMEIRKKNYSAAISILNRCLEEDPENLEALFQRGVYYLEIGEIENACQDWNIIKSLKSQRANEMLKQYCKN